MSFIYPLGLLGLLAIPIIIIIYILRSRYKSKSVSSTFIWKRSLKYVKRKIPLNFIMSLLLILQILTVVAASFAIARPTIKPLETEERIVILDASASMLAKNGKETRFEHAKKLIEEEAEDIGSNSQITLILAGEEAISVVTRETDKGEFLTALRGLTCTMGDSNIADALTKATDVLNLNRGAKIQLYTDKEYVNTDDIEVIDCKRDGEWNAGVLTLEENVLINGTEFVASIGNYGLDSRVSVKLRIDGEVAAQKIIDLKPNQVVSVRFTHSTTADAGRDEIRVNLSKAVKKYTSATVELNTEDSFKEDNSFTLYPRNKENPKIAYVSTHVVDEAGKKHCSSTLFAAIKAAGYEINTDNMFTDIISAGDLKGYDLYIFEGITPYVLPTDGGVWLLNAKEAFAGETGIIISNEVKDTSGTDAGFRVHKSLGVDIVSEIVKNVDFDTPIKFPSLDKEIYASVTSYRPIANIGSFRPIYTANDQDIMIAGNNGSVRMVVSTFDFSMSSMPIFISDFPLLIRNMVNFSIPDPVAERTAPVGSEISFNFPAGAKVIERYFDGKLVNKIEVDKLIQEIKTNPDKALKEGETLADRLKETFTIETPGKYEVRVVFPDGDDMDTVDDVKSYSVTGHVSQEESMIVQRVPTESLVAPEPVDGAVETAEPVEIFPYIIALLILLLIIEWGVYYREQY